MTDWHAEIDVQLGKLKLSVQLSGDHAPLALVGPNGSGKTTLLRIIAGALRPARGKIQVGDAILFDSATSVDLPPEARSVGYVPQGYGLFPHLSALDNVAFGLSLGSAAKGRGARRTAALEMLKTLQCEDLALRLPRRLSGGEQQRVALARALLMNPKMLLLDEPVSALDAGARRRVRAFLAQRLLALSRPSIVVTHDARDVAALGATVCVLDAGRIVQRGKLETLRASPANEFVAEFVGADSEPRFAGGRR